MLLHRFRRVTAALGNPQGGRRYVPRKNFTKTTAAGPLPGATQDCELNRRRQTPSNAFANPDEDTLIVPTRTLACTHLSDTTRREFTPAVDA